MKKYNITVNGKTYEVEVEEVGGVMTTPAAPPKAQPVTPVAKPAPAPVAVPTPAPAPVVAPASTSPVAGESVGAPLPGKIIKVVAGVGTAVKSGDVVVILEAMKMENEITAPTAGTIQQVNVSEGATVNPGDILFVIG